MTDRNLNIYHFTTPELESYRIAIENLANNKEATLFKNSKDEHNAIVIANIFRTSCQNVKIFGKSTYEALNHEYTLQSLRLFLSDEKKLLSVIFYGDINYDSKFFNLIDKPSVAISIRQLPATLDKSMSIIIGDNRMCWVKSESRAESMYSFNNTDLSKEAQDIFNRISAASSDLKKATA